MSIVNNYDMSRMKMCSGPLRVRFHVDQLNLFNMKNCTGTRFEAEPQGNPKQDFNTV